MRTGFGGADMPNAVAEVAYEQSFMGMPEGTYSDGLRSIDKRKEIEQRFIKKVKALMTKDLTTTGNEYASGVLYSAVAGNLPVLIPIYVDTDIIDLVRRETPLYELLPKRAIKGKFADFNQMTVRNAGAFLPEGAALAVADDTYVRQVIPVKYAYAIGKVTGPAISAMRGYIDILREQVQTHTVSLVQMLENEIINGSVAVNPNGFNGLLLQIVTNVQALAGAPLTIPIMRLAIRQARSGSIAAGLAVGGGNPNLIVTDLLRLDQIKALLQGWLRYPAPTVSLAWGIQTVEFEGIPIIASKYMSMAANLGNLIVIDTSVVYLAILQDLVLEELARTDDATKFMIKWYGCLVVKAETFCAEVNTIA